MSVGKHARPHCCRFRRTGVVVSELPHSEESSPVPTHPTVTVESQACSILDKLKAPMKSDLARKHKIERPQTPTAQTKKHKSSVTNQTDPKSASTTYQDFPNECSDVRNSKLFCIACREELALKKSTVKNSGDKHKKAKERLTRKEARKCDIVQSLQAYDKEVEPAGTNVSMEQRVYRVKVVEQFLRAGIPLAKLTVYVIF